MAPSAPRQPSIARFLNLLGVLALAAAGALLPLERPARADDAALAKHIRGTMQPFVAKADASGIVTVVGSADGILALNTVGLRSIEKGLPMRPDTVFRIASMTKPITAIGIMMLADEKKLAIEDLVEKHLPEFRGQMLVAAREGDTITLKKPARPITLRDLLTHTSGLPGAPPAGLSDLYAKRNHTLAEGVMAYSQRPLDFEPGSRWAYCNTGIDTLGRVIEVVSGQSYEAFLKERLFDPLGMKDTTFYPTPAQLERTAVTYIPKDEKLQPAGVPLIGPPAGARYPVPAGGLYSTAPDLAKLYQMMLGKGSLGGRRYLSEESVAAMTRTQTGEIKTGFTDGMSWGLGWGVVREPTGVAEALSAGTYGHGGAFGTQAWIDPHKGRFAVLLIQRSGLKNSDASEMRAALQKAAFTPLPAPAPKPVAVAAAAVTPAPAPAPAAPVDIEGVVSAIQKLGGKVERDDKGNGKPVTVVNLGLTEVKDADLEPLEGLASVKKLTLNDTPITDAALDHLKGLSGLEKLYLVDTKVTDAGLERLIGLKSLQVLSLAGTQVSDAGLEYLKAMTGLKEVFLYGTKVGDDGAKKLKEAMPNLKVYR
jgi:CubicO group peptidase (beta-lactamase class C family)